MLARPLGCLSLVAILAGCIDHPTPPTIADDGTGKLPASTPGTPAGAPATPPAVDPVALLSESVTLVVTDNDGNDSTCTGVLVANDTVLTAAHCLDNTQFASWAVIATLANGAPKVSASNPTVFTSDWSDVANPDIGFLKLDSPIDLPAYAVVTDVSTRVDQEKLTAVAMVRTDDGASSPFKPAADLAVQSTTSFGYAHGIGTPLFSQDGDSGAGLFLVEDGKPTHKLIGILREPDPDRQLDHFTRIDPDVQKWLSDNGAGAVAALGADNPLAP